MPELRRVKTPHPRHTASRELVTQRADTAVDALVERLTRPASEGVERAGRPAGVAANAQEDDQEMFFARGWTDGLPVSTPTLQKVRRMIEASGRDAGESVGPLPPRWRMATIEKIAINAVLAGCRPEYFPVVLAAVEALLDNDCQLYGIQTATNTTAPRIIPNRPIVDDLGLNARGNDFAQGPLADATIGPAGLLAL